MDREEKPVDELLADYVAKKIEKKHKSKKDKCKNKDYKEKKKKHKKHKRHKQSSDDDDDDKSPDKKKRRKHEKSSKEKSNENSETKSSESKGSELEKPKSTEKIDEKETEKSIEKNEETKEKSAEEKEGVKTDNGNNEKAEAEKADLSEGEVVSDIDENKTKNPEDNDKKKSDKKCKKHKHKKTKKSHLDRRSRSRSRSSSRSRTRRPIIREGFMRYDSRSRSPYRYERAPRKRSRSPGISPLPDSKAKDLREKIDKARLLQVARKNVLDMIEKGTLPKGVNIDNFKQEQLAMLKSGGKSVAELTEYCKKLAKRDDEPSSDSDDDRPRRHEDSEPLFINHPFKLKDPKPITLNIRNAVPLPVKTPAEKAVESAKLRLLFPVSSGNQHRAIEWVPVNKDDKTKNGGKKNPTQDTVISSTSKKEEPLALPAPPTEPVAPMQQYDFNAIKESQKDISSVVAQRLQCMKRLQQNANDVEALNQLYQIQKEVQEWAKSKQLVGQFTGCSDTDIRLLTPEELSGPFPVWARKDQMTKTTPLGEGIGMSLLKKMGWNPGEGLGKNKEGALEPLLLDVKMDKKGLVSQGEVAHKVPFHAVAKDLSGKHPVSSLMELCAKRKWGTPDFQVVEESGPDHRKTFLFKVKINGVEYQPNSSSNNKKVAKAMCATVCLQSLGLLPR